MTEETAAVDEARIDEGQDEKPRAPVERRSAEIADLNVGQRIATVIVAPYNQTTPVVWRDEVWTESFERGAWDNLEKRPNRVRANRAHDKRYTCGRAVKFFPNHDRGLVAEVRMADTDLGHETLRLLVEDCLGVSAGFAALPSDQIIDRRNKTRRIRTAYLDHISFVEDPAYPGAELIDVRENALILPEEYEQLPASAPVLEPFQNLPGLAWANERLNSR